MYVLKGFVTHALLANNAPGVNAPIGELSTQSLTYSREKGFYVSDDAPDLTLVTFLSAQDTTLVTANGVLPEGDTVAEHALKITKFIYDKTFATTNPVFADELLEDLIVAFTTTATDFTCGPIVNDGRYYVPQWISWKHKHLNVSNENNQFKIWLTDAAFKSQYDEFEIVVIPPLLLLNDFFRTGGEVEVLLKARTISETMDLIQAAKNGAPETVVRIDEYLYVDPLNTAHKVASKWGILIYGAAGNNVDAIKDALIAFILANSTHIRSAWTPLLPDIFKRTEFILLPLWEQYAIPNRTLEAGIYSPVVNLTDALNLIKAVASTYSPTHINTYASVMGHPYKSLAIVAVGGPENRDNKFKLTDIFSDYVNVSSTSIDFNRMAVDTKNWLLLLAEMVLTAENMTLFSDIPAGMTKMERNGVLYLVKNYQNIHYLVAAKMSFPL